MWWQEVKNVNVLEGKTLKDIKVKRNEEIIFTVDDGTRYRMFHDNVVVNMYT